MKSASQPYGCGQCLPCRFNKRRLWTNRLLLELRSHGDAAFVTLTYSDDFLPKNKSLDPKQLKLWMKRLNKLAGGGLRYYNVGEYGDQTQRPHYHALIFGLPPNSPLFARAWSDPKSKKPFGHVYLGSVEENSIQYVAGYVTKKMTSKHDPRLKGRSPEFARMSLKPGIGAMNIAAIADVLTTSAGASSIIANGDVPSALKQGRKTLPLGRYLRTKIRKELGHAPSCPEEMLLRLQQEKAETIVLELKKPENISKSVKQIFLELNRQKVLNLESRLKIFSKKGPL